jgi:trans-aconitate 2-methyltransferase
VTEALLEPVSGGSVLAIDASQEMVDLASERLGDRARVWRQDVLDLVLDEPVDVVVSTATLHWVPDHERLWQRLAAALRCAAAASSRSSAAARATSTASEG